VAAGPAQFREDAIVAFARDLVAIPTENPPGAAYHACVQRICAELDALTIAYELVETGDDETHRQAIVASVGDRGPLLYLHGHYDVVPAFSRAQFEPRVEDGRLVGRGASDMKGGLAAIVYGACAAAEARARIGLIIVPDEETGGRLGAERLDVSAVGAIVAEPTWGTIWHACRGAFTLHVAVRGKAAHVGLHYEGVNAFAAAVEVALALRELEQALRERKSARAFSASDPRADESILLVGGLSGGGINFNIVPEGSASPSTGGRTPMRTTTRQRGSSLHSSRRPKSAASTSTGRSCRTREARQRRSMASSSNRSSPPPPPSPARRRASRAVPAPSRSVSTTGSASRRSPSDRA